MMPQDDFTTTFKDIQDLRNHAELVIESIKDAISEPFPTKKAPSFTSQHLSEITGLKKSRINYLMNTRPELPSGQLEGAGKAKKFTLEEVMQWVEYAVEEKMAEIAKFKDKKSVIVFCRSGNRSGMAKSLLEQQGITNVVNGGTWQNVAQFVQ